MNFITDLVPTWISILFLIVIPIPVFLIARLAKKGSNDSKSGTRSQMVVLLFYAMYFIYVGVATGYGLFKEVTLPPKILRFTMVPLLLFLLLVVSNLTWYKTRLKNLELSDLVQVHIFRLIGSFFLILGFFQVLPASIAIIAGCGDVITALSSIYVVKCLREGRSYAKKLTFAWNTFGLLDIIATSASALILTKLSIDTGSLGVDALGVFPYCLIPAFAPATIIFLHISIYRKLSNKA